MTLLSDDTHPHKMYPSPGMTFPTLDTWEKEFRIREYLYVNGTIEFRKRRIDEYLLKKMHTLNKKKSNPEPKSNPQPKSRSNPARFPWKWPHSNSTHKQMFRSIYVCSQGDLRDKLSIPDNVFIRYVQSLFYGTCPSENAFKDDQKHPPSRVLQRKHLQLRWMNLQL